MDSQTLTPVEVARFANFRAHELLYEFDGPQIFTAIGRDQKIYLAYHVDDDDIAQIARYLVVPSSDEVVNALKAGRMTVRGALDQPEHWLVQTNYQGEIVSAFEVPDLSVIGEDCLPQPEELLYAHLEPRPQ